MGKAASRIGQGVAALCALAVQAEVRLPAVISDHMVVQSGAPVRLWGWAAPGETVNATLASAKAVAVAGASGAWVLDLPPVRPGGPYTLKVNDRTVNDVLAGEVWVGSGQSNMAMSLGRSAGGKQEAAKANWPRIRFFKVPNLLAANPQEDLKGKWESLTPANAEQYSGVAYYFAKSLHLERGVPFGIIQTAWGGTSAQAWTRREALDEDADLREYLTRAPRNPQNASSVLWNAMVHPIKGYGIRGFLWYQGEANRQGKDAYLYRKLFSAMIQDWRSQWGMGQLPFLWVLLAPFTSPAPTDLPLTRESQLETLKLANVGFSNTLGIGDAKDIHPTNKKVAGERLANAARRVAYGSATAPVSPLLRQVTVEGAALRLWFDHAGSGLKFSGDPNSAFEIAGAGEVYVPATAKVEGSTVLVRAASVAEPVFVRYAYKDVAPDVLYSLAGVPAAPFRSRVAARE